jgi:hypothetical protein
VNPPISDFVPGTLRRRAAACVAVLAFLLAVAPGVAAARSLVPGAPAQMSLVFTRGTAHLVGRNALVGVKCVGSRNGTCSGTVTLTVRGHKRKAPFSVIGGSAQSLVVPVASHGRAAVRGVAVARTVQAAGGYARSSGVLHFR